MQGSQMMEGLNLVMSWFGYPQSPRPDHTQNSVTGMIYLLQ